MRARREIRRGKFEGRLQKPVRCWTELWRIRMSGRMERLGIPPGRHCTVTEPVLALCLCVMVACAPGTGGRTWELASPDGRLVLAVEYVRGGRSIGPSGERACLFYRLKHRGPGKAMDLILPSPLGIERNDACFTGDLRLTSSSKVRPVEERYTLASGKRRFCRNSGNELVLRFKNSDSVGIHIEFRAYGDGAAFRYRFPDSARGEKTILSETTGFRLPSAGTAFIQPYQDAGKYTPAYEAYYQNGIPVGTDSPTGSGWCFPALFRLHGGSAWVLLTEAGLDGSYCGSHLDGRAPGGLYRIRFPESGEGNGVGTGRPSSELPWSTPWRVIVAGPSADAIVRSTLVTDVSPASAFPDADWVRPGRVSWGWWSEQDSPKKAGSLRRFVDLAAAMGWEYTLVDANWNTLDSRAIPELVRYAAEKKVGVILWYNSGGPHNVVTEAPRDRVTDPAVRRKEFAWLRRIGAKGVKVDFFQSDKQESIRLYLDILKDAADHRILVNFHGCTVPRGWSRTFPNLMSMEGVRGAESYIFDSTYAASAPLHNTILPFTRNAVGSMDYTPVTFSNNTYPHRTTGGHELALAVVFESGWQHMADRPYAYLRLPAAPLAFLRNVPVSWDDVRLLDGEPGKRAVLGRRKGVAWWVGGINGENRPVESTIEFHFLENTPYRLEVINDGPGVGFRQWNATVTAADSLTVPIAAYGGFVAKLTPEG